MILEKNFFIKYDFIRNAVLSILIITVSLCLSNCNTFIHNGNKTTLLSAQEKKEGIYKTRHSITIANITDETGGSWWNPVIGRGISEMLSTALFYTNHYTVLEYDDNALQGINDSSYSKETNNEILNRPVPSELIITGSVISFKPAVYNRFGRLAKQPSITIDLTIVETASLNKIAEFTIAGKSDDPDINEKFTGFNGCFDEWVNTPECDAIKSCITMAIATIVIKTDTWYLDKEEDRLQTHGSEENKGQFITVIAERANVRKGPGTNSDIECVVTKGENFKVIGKKGSWYKILLQSGKVAWIYKTLIK